MESCFNRIDRVYLSQVLAEYGIPRPLRKYIERVNRAIPMIKLEDLKEEAELELKSNYLIKNGLPQGLPWSPICAILVIDKTFRELNLDPILYADDGLLMLNKKIDIFKYQKFMKHRGLILSKKVKNGKPVTG